MHPIWTLVAGLTAWQVYTRVRKRWMGRRTQSLHLTFDDGPHPEHTPRVLDLLERHGAKATFFLRGDSAEKHPELVRRLMRAGHAVGNHSFSHVPFDTLSWRSQLDEIRRTDRVLEQIDGVTRHVFRPPYGRLTPAAIVLCVLRGQRVALWTHDSLDFRLDASAIVQRLRQIRLRAGDILLFHDDGSSGVTALEQLLPEWQSAGFDFSLL